MDINTDKDNSGIKDVVRYLINDYDCGVVTKQPEKSIIIDILNNIQFILFPEYFRNRYDMSNLEYSLGSVLENVSYHLRNQIEYALKCKSEYSTYPELTVLDSQNVIREFISKIPMVREYLLTDVEAAYEGDPAAYSKAEIIISYPGLFAVMVHRIAHELFLLNVPLIPRMMSEYAHSITGIDIHPGASVGKYFFIDHGTGVVIGETAVIGSHVKIYQGVTLGALSTRGGQSLKGVKRHPTIEDYVIIYSGASILGGDTIIGESVIIGSNAFIIKSVPDKTKVSIRNPELQFKNRDKTESVRIELEQDEFWHYTI